MDLVFYVEVVFLIVGITSLLIIIGRKTEKSFLPAIAIVI